MRQMSAFQSHTGYVNVRVGMTCLGLSMFWLSGCSGDPIQERWESRDPLPSCGEYELDNSDDRIDATRDGFDCLREGLSSGEGGEVVMSFSTDEGDPLTHYYRVTTKGAYEIYRDATEDAFGSGKWEYQDCGAVDTPTVTEC